MMSTKRFGERINPSSIYIAPKLEARGYFGSTGGYDLYGNFLIANRDLADLIHDESISDSHITAIICRRFDEWFAKQK